jgi:adenylate cyclase
MFTDMIGYTALAQKNESLSLELVKQQRDLLRPILTRHDGREVKTMGDAFLVEFSSALDAVRCAYDIQRATRDINVSLSEDRRVHLRVGIHLGDVVEAGGDISGDAVNIASRIESIADDGGVCLTRQVYDQVKNKFELPLESLGEKRLKNVHSPVEIFRMSMPWEERKSTLSAQPDSRKIAILPFTNMSPDPNDSYFADGITEEIISTVSNVSGLKVISRTSTMGYKGTNKKMAEIGRELGVGSILEGSLRKAGNTVRITTQLIDVNTDEHIWAQSYNRQLDDIFAVQTDIAREVTDALKTTIQTSESVRISKKPTESATAHSLYLRGRYHWNKRGVGDIKKAMEYFEEALKEDPNFALGYVGLADCHLILAENWAVDRERNREKAKSLSARALELDRELAEAHATRGLLLQSEYVFPEAEEEFRAAIALKPSYASAHQWYSHLLIAQLRWDEALEHLNKALELDPFHPTINMNQTWPYFIRKDYPKALKLAKKAIELDPSNILLRITLAQAYGKMKMFGDARREMNEAIRLSKDTFPSLAKQGEAVIAYLEDDKETVRRLMPELEKTLDDPFGFKAVETAGLYFYLGMNDKGFEWLERSYTRREQDLAYIKTNENLDSVRSDSRYFSLLKRLGLE